MDALHIPMVHTAIAEYLDAASVNRFIETERNIDSALLDELRIHRLQQWRLRLLERERVHVVCAQALRRRARRVADRIDRILG